MSDTPLKPCPFCGGEAEFNDHYRDEVKCKSCGAKRIGITPERAVSEWSRRTFPSTPRDILYHAATREGDRTAAAALIDDLLELAEGDSEREPTEGDFVRLGFRRNVDRYPNMAVFECYPVCIRLVVPDGSQGWCWLTRTQSLFASDHWRLRTVGQLRSLCRLFGVRPERGIDSVKD